MENAKNEKKEIVTLPMILERFSEEGQKLSWSILNLDASGDLGEDKPIPEFESFILKSPQGYPLEWDELCDMAARFEQVIGLLLIGCKNKETILGFTEVFRDVDLSNCEIIIYIDDGEFVSIEAKDEKIIERVEKCFGPLPRGIY